MSKWLDERGLGYRAAAESAYSTDANIWGATHEAKRLEELDVSMEIVEPLMGVAHWRHDVEIQEEDVVVTFDQGVPSAVNGQVFESHVWLVRAVNEIGGRHASV